MWPVFMNMSTNISNYNIFSIIVTTTAVGGPGP